LVFLKTFGLNTLHSHWQQAPTPVPSVTGTEEAAAAAVDAAAAAD
jgi:hypothetical protein